ATNRSATPDGPSVPGRVASLHRCRSVYKGPHDSAKMRNMQEVSAGQTLYVVSVARDRPSRLAVRGGTMIKNIHVTGVSVSDQDRALDFYTTKLGFEKRADISVGDYRWIEVVPPGAETALVLEPGQGTVGTFTSVVFTTDD